MKKDRGRISRAGEAPAKPPHVARGFPARVVLPSVATFSEWTSLVSSDTETRTVYAIRAGKGINLWVQPPRESP